MSTPSANIQLAVDELTKRLQGTAINGSPSTSSASSAVVDWQGLTDLAQRCADSLRSADARSTLGGTSLILTCSGILEKSLLESSSSSPPDVLSCQTQLCRIVGNLVLDHPSNRVRCLDAKIPQRLLRLLEHLTSTSNSSGQTSLLATIKAATGALLNLAIDTPNIRQTLAEPSALDILSNNLQFYRLACWRDASTFSNAANVDAITRAKLVEWTLKLVSELLSDENVQITKTTALALSKCILSLPLPSTPEYDRSASIYADMSYEDMYTLVETDLSIFTSATELLEGHSYKSEFIQEDLALENLPGSNTTVLGAFMDFLEFAEILPSYLPVIKQDLQEGDTLEIEKTFANVKGSVGRIVMAAVSSDKVMHITFSSKGDTDLAWLLPRCIQWLNGRPDLIITSSTMLANIVRKDTYSVALLHDYDLAADLASLLKKYSQPPPSSSTARPGEATQILHGVTGLLRNLAIAAPNKQILCDAGVIEPCASLLRPEMDMVLPLQNSAVGVLKHLCAGNIASSLEIILPTAASSASEVQLVTDNTSKSRTPLAVVLALIKRTNDVRLKCEATRLLVNLIRSLYSSRSLASPITPAAVHGLELGLVKNKAKTILESSTEVVEALSELLRTGEKYPILVNEAVVALTLLSTTKNGAKLTLVAITQNSGGIDVKSTSAPEVATAAAPIRSQTNGYSSRSGTLNASAQNAPPASIDVLVKWLTDYAIDVPVLQPEMIGNVISLLESLFRVEEARTRECLSNEKLRSALLAVANRDAPSPSGAVVRRGAQQVLDRLTP